MIKNILKTDSSDTDRLEMFSDGVFAIVITLLVLEIRVPEIIHQVSSAEFVHELLLLWPKFFVFALSFVVIYIIWMNHHQTFKMIVKSNRGLMLLNGFLLFFIVLIPFPTALVGEYPLQPASAIIYGVLMALMGLSFVLMYWYISKHGLVEDAIPQTLLKKGFRRAMVSPIFYIIGALFALIYLPISYVIYSLIAIYYLIPAPWNRNLNYLFSFDIINFKKNY